MAAIAALAPIPCANKANKKGIASFLTAAQFELLEAIMMPKRAKAGTVLFWEGEPSGKLIYVRSGKVMLRKSTEDGKSLILSILQAGDLIGELDGSRGVVHSYSAAVMDNAELGIISWKDIDTLLVQQSDFALPFMSWMALNHRVAESKLRDLLLFGKPGALASTLIRMANSFGIAGEDGIRINLKLTNTEMADFIGTTRESVNRMLNGLKEEGTIDMQGGRIVIRDLNALKKICGCPDYPACPPNVCCI